MKEKIHNAKNNGIAILAGIILLYLAFVFIFINGILLVSKADEAGVTSVIGILMIIIGSVWMGLGWFPLLGLKVLGPQQALVLTLFGEYTGTLKGEGFYFVNPFSLEVETLSYTIISLFTFFSVSHLKSGLKVSIFFSSSLIL